MNNYKIKIGNDPNLSRRVQEHAFSLGYAWRLGHETTRTPQYNSSPYLYLYNSGKIAHNSGVEYFKYHKNEQISPEEFLSLGAKMNEYKIHIGENNPELSRLVQEHAFKLGWRWAGKKKNDHETQSFLYFRSDGSMQYGSYKKGFRDDDSYEISIPDFLALTPQRDFKLGCKNLKLREDQLTFAGGEHILDIKTDLCKSIIDVYTQGSLHAKVGGHKVRVNFGGLFIDGDKISEKESDELINAVHQARSHFPDKGI